MDFLGFLYLQHEMVQYVPVVPAKSTLLLAQYVFDQLAQDGVLTLHAFDHALLRHFGAVPPMARSVFGRFSTDKTSVNFQQFLSCLYMIVCPQGEDVVHHSQGRIGVALVTNGVRTKKAASPQSTLRHIAVFDRKKLRRKKILGKGSQSLRPAATPQCYECSDVHAG